MRTSWTMALLLVLGGCGSATKEAPAAPAEGAPASGAEAAAAGAAAERLFGQRPDEAIERVALADIVAAPEQWAGKVVRVEGTIGKVCEKRGCWMDLRDGETTVRIPMAGHRFFLPQDVIGHEAVVQGTVQLVGEYVEDEAEAEGHEHPEGEEDHEQAEHAEGEACHHTEGHRVIVEATGVLVR